MKTLDEVIEIFEKVVKHDYVWFDEKTALMTIETLTDTLHYLKELQDMTDIPMEYFESGVTSQKLRNTSQITCPKCHSEFVILPEANNALTWDELRRMEGKPVWIELLGKGLWKGWDVIAGFDEDDFGVAMVTVHNDDYYLADLNKTWQAYRKERK